MTASADARWWSSSPDGVLVSVRVTPGARRSGVVDATGDRLRLRVTAPASEGRANEEVRRLLASRFGVRPAAVSLVRGARSREKTLLVGGVHEPPGELRDGTGARGPGGAQRGRSG